jgi:hypothetical protein
MNLKVKGKFYPILKHQAVNITGGSGGRAAHFLISLVGGGLSCSSLSLYSGTIDRRLGGS